MDAAVHPHEVIDLSGDDDNEEELFQQYLRDAFPDHDAIGGGGELDGEADDLHRDFVDLTRLEPPDPLPAAESPSFTDPASAAAMDLDGDNAPVVTPEHANRNNSLNLSQPELVTAAACLQMIVDVLPDISVDYALQFVADRTRDDARTPEACQRIISELLDAGPYPKEQEEASRKRKREFSWDEFENDDGNGRNQEYRLEAVKLLQDEFLDIPVQHLNKVIREHRTIYRAYAVIEEQVRNQSHNRRGFTPIAKPRTWRAYEIALISSGSQLPKELAAARRKCEEIAAKRRKEEETHQEEEKNLREAILAGEMQECPCCCDDMPLNRMVRCNGKTMHFFCKPCVKQYVETEMGSSRCRPVCFADPDCGGTFTRIHLQQCLGEVSFDRLEHMQQMKDLEMAGLDLDECPFCDFKQDCPPIDEDSEFRCLHPKCRKTSCRLCLKLSHVPLSCEENKKDEKLTVRHIVEEAMTAALIRSCNKCKRSFIKEAGCNKMTCPNCRHVQCYVCSASITNYDHFHDHGGRGKCPLHDNIEKRHKEEVQNAADEAMAKVKAENPGLSDADLMVQVSDRVKQAEQQRQAALDNIPGPVEPPHMGLFANRYPRVNNGAHQPHNHQPPGAPPRQLFAPLPPFPPPAHPAQNQYVPAAVQYPPPLPPFDFNPGYAQQPYGHQQPLWALPFCVFPAPPQDHAQLMPVGVVPLQPLQVPVQAQQQQAAQRQAEQGQQDPHPQQHHPPANLLDRAINYMRAPQHPVPPAPLPGNPPGNQELLGAWAVPPANPAPNRDEELMADWFGLPPNPALNPAPGQPVPRAPRAHQPAQRPPPYEDPSAPDLFPNRARNGFNNNHVNHGNANNVGADGGHVVADALRQAAQQVRWGRGQRRRRNRRAA